MKGSLVFHALFIHTLFYTVAASDALGSKSARRRTQHWKLRQAHENLINNPLDKPVNNPLDGSPLDPTSSTSVPVVSTSTFTSATTSIVSTRTTGLASSSTISSSPTSAPAPTQTSDPAAEQDIATVTERRVSQIVGGLSGAKSISSWCVFRMLRRFLPLISCDLKAVYSTKQRAVAGRRLHYRLCCSPC